MHTNNTLLDTILVVSSAADVENTPGASHN